MKRRLDFLALVGAFLMVVDTMWGGVAIIILDLAKINELIMAISFVLGLPIYLLDLWMDTRIAASLLGLFLFRWIARCFGGSAPTVVSPWPFSQLILSAFVFLQLSKMRRARELRRTTYGA